MEEEILNLHQAVAMLRNDKNDERERWLDWLLSYLLNHETKLENMNLNLRKEIFSLLATVFLLEIHEVSETNPIAQCSDNLLSYLLRGIFNFWSAGCLI